MKNKCSNTEQPEDLYVIRQIVAKADNFHI